MGIAITAVFMRACSRHRWECGMDVSCDAVLHALSIYSLSLTFHRNKSVKLPAIQNGEKGK
jgi:hypothetical protein